MNNMRMRSSLQAVRLLAKCSELNVQLPEMESLEKVNNVHTPQFNVNMCFVCIQLVSQLQWLQKAESALKPDVDSSATNTVRSLSDMLKEGNEIADNKCMCCVAIIRDSNQVLLVCDVTHSDDRNL